MLDASTTTFPGKKLFDEPIPESFEIGIYSEVRDIYWKLIKCQILSTLERQTFSKLIRQEGRMGTGRREVKTRCHFVCPNQQV